MKKVVTILAFMFLFQISNGQDTIRRFEFGSTLITIKSFYNSNYSAQDRPPIEFINGLFFRYTKKRLGIRAHASYSENFSSYTAHPNCFNCESGDINNKDFRIGIGGQFSILKKKEWFYTFIDISYRNVFSTGSYSSVSTNANNLFSSTANGIDSFFGLGFKAKLLKSIYVSPELCYNIFYGIINSSTTSLTSGQTTKSNSLNGHLNPVAKLHLTIKL